jgi:hypothetical protein
VNVSSRERGAVVISSGRQTGAVSAVDGSSVGKLSIRSTGVGWGRVGAIAGALFGTVLVATGLSIEAACMIAAVLATIGAVAVALVRAQNQSATVYV